mgnify:FL=1
MNNNANAFNKEVIEVGLILSDEAIKFLDENGYNYLFEEYKDSKTNKDNIYYRIIISLFLNLNKAILRFETHIYNENTFEEDVKHTEGIKFTKEVSEYFKTQAIKTINGNISAMKKCVFWL